MYQTCAGIVPIIGYTALLGQDYENYWSSFSGKQEIGETPPQTAIREFNEETSNMWGLTPQQFEKRLLHRFSTRTPSGKVLWLFVLNFENCQNLRNFFPNREKKAVRWVSMSENVAQLHPKFRQDYHQVRKFLQSRRLSSYP